MGRDRATLPRPARRAAAFAAAVLAACSTPPPEVFTSSGTARTTEARSAGTDARGDACFSQAGSAPALDRPVGSAQEAFCGGWTQPAARVFSLRGSARPEDLQQLAAGGIWRQWLNERAICGPPQPTRLDDGSQALLLSCTRRQGGWPHLALVTSGPDGPVVADGIPASLPVMERLARGAVAGMATARSEALQLQAVQLSVRAFGSPDIRDFDRAMVLGAELNQVEDFAGAEDAYRAALAIQERVLGVDNADTVGALSHLAVNLSNQRRYREADTLFARAERLAPRATDVVAAPRLQHYRGLHAVNQSRYETAVEQFRRAEALYAPLIPAQLLAGAGEPGLAALNPTTRSAMLGLAELRRSWAVAEARQGRASEAQRQLQASRSLLRLVADERGMVGGRVLRAEARTLGEGAERAGPLLERAAQSFRQGTPNERPEATTLFLVAQRHAAAGRNPEALAAFRAGAQILRSRQRTLEPSWIIPYLDALAAEARRSPAAAADLQREMFAAAQLAQRGQTVRFMAQSAARLASGQGDPRVSEAVRRLQDLDREIRELFAERDARGTGRPAEVSAIDDRIADRQRARLEAESEAAAAAPGYRQLLLASAGAEDVGRVLGPGEVLVQLLLGPRHGYAVSVAGGGRVEGRRIELSESQAAALVGRIRQAIDEGAGVLPFDTEAAHELYGRTLAPVAEALTGAERLIIVPDGPLLSLPFGLLLTEQGRPAELRDAAWLIRRHAVVHATSPQALVTLRAGAPASDAPRPYIGFGDFVPPTPAQLARSFPAERCAEDARLAAGLVRLPGTRAEVEAAARRAGADGRSTVFGDAFTAASLRNADLGDHRIVHLATHALLPGELSCLPEPSIVLSPPRGAADAAGVFLRASEVLSLRLNADLVILSACNTAGPGTGATGGTGPAGEALSGLARSFFFAGARGLLVTHWPVVDAAAAITVADMMRRQEQGADSAAALRGAQLLLLDEAGAGLPAQFAHPYYWAGFALLGDGRRSPRRVAAGTPNAM